MAQIEFINAGFTVVGTENKENIKISFKERINKTQLAALIKS